MRSWKVFQWDKVADLPGEEHLHAGIETLKTHLPAELLEAIDRA